MGAIIVNRIIGPDFDLPIRIIVHVASADSINNLLYFVVPYLMQGKNPVRFYSPSLHPENEDREVSVCEVAPSGSPLVRVDDVFTHTPDGPRPALRALVEQGARAATDRPKAREKMSCKIHGLNSPGGDEVNGVTNASQQPGDFDTLPIWREHLVERDAGRACPDPREGYLSPRQRLRWTIRPSTSLLCRYG